MIRIWLVALVVLASLGVGTRPASAEWFADLFAGLSLTRDHDLKLNDQGIGQGTYESVEFDRSLAWGGRFGRYFDSVPFVGLALDFFRFYPDIGGQSVQLRGCFFPGGCGTGRGGTGSLEVQTTAVSVDLMLRLPLWKSTEAPQGRVQPYVAVGPPFFITTITPRNTRNFRNHDDDTDYSFGFKAAAGVAVQVFSNLALFGEYRFTHVSPEVELHDANLNRTTLRTDLDTHSALVGISARW
ncbi:MAG TPA: outer membrane beta-barrel protein [Methylomirabilota bacterium]|jgi:opacity protein-like surface antigen|nr:outer membrane beta-barrel protein [Methylomirabilota bacterium]